MSSKPKKSTAKAAAAAAAGAGAGASAIPKQALTPAHHFVLQYIMATRSIGCLKLKKLFSTLYEKGSFNRPGWGDPVAELSVAVLDLNAHLAPAGLFIESAGPDGAPTADDTKRLYTLVNTRTDEVAAQTARWELWEQKAFVQIYHTLRKPAPQGARASKPLKRAKGAKDAKAPKASISRDQVDSIAASAITKHKAFKHVLIGNFIDKALEGRWLMSADSGDEGDVEAGKTANRLSLGPRSAAELLNAYAFDKDGLSVASAGASRHYDSEEDAAPAARAGGGRSPPPRRATRPVQHSESEGEVGRNETDESEASEAADASPVKARRGGSRSRATKRPSRRAEDLPSDEEDSDVDAPVAASGRSKRARRGSS